MDTKLSTTNNKKNGLNYRQKKFVEVYQGNATEAARLAGYKGSDNYLSTHGARLMRDERIARAIRDRECNNTPNIILNRQERQGIWSKIAQDQEETTTNRLKALELLGKSEADFADRLLVGRLEQTLEELSSAEIRQRIEYLEAELQGRALPVLDSDEGENE